MTTIVSVRRGNQVVLGGDGQVSLGNTVMKGNARKVRRLYHDKVIAGFAGGTADAFTLFERFESQLEKHHGQLVRAAVELAKEWRSDRALRKLEAMLVVANEDASLIISGTGDVIEPEHGLIAIGSGGWEGKGFLQGTQTKGGFVPEQHTDYIFSTIGEEWGFKGTAGVVLLFTFLILRILSRAEAQKNNFSRVYAYSAASILFVHFFVNIGMSIGLVPTIGIPLPFISYGGSSLLAFTILIAIYLNQDANRLNEASF